MGTSLSPSCELVWRYAQALKNAARRMEFSFVTTGTRVPVWIETSHLFGRPFADRAKFLVEQRERRRTAAEDKIFLDAPNK